VDTTTSAALYDSITLPALRFHWAVLLLFTTLPAAAVAGYVTGLRRRTRLLEAGQRMEAVVGETTLSAVLALLGLLLAFTFGNALTLAMERKNATIAEAAALGTVFLRADYLAEPGRTALQLAIHDYAQTRILPGGGRIDTVEKAQAFLETSLQAQAVLWPLTLEATRDPTPPAVKTFVAGAMNEALDAHLYRVKLLSTPLSDITQAMLLAAALVSLFLLGDRSGMNGRKLTWRTFVLSGVLFLVMSTILDAQRSGEGIILADDTSLRATLFDMQQALGDRLAAE